MEQSDRLSYESPVVIATFEAQEVMGAAHGQGSSATSGAGAGKID